MLAEELGAAMIISFGDASLYYTGISNLFSQPEFRNANMTVNVSAMFDQCEERIPALKAKLQPQTTSVFIGSENPLGTACAAVGTRFEKDDIVVTALGPMRMSYAKAVAYVGELNT